MVISKRIRDALDQPITVFSATRDRIIVAIWEPTESGNTIEALGVEA